MKPAIKYFLITLGVLALLAPLIFFLVVNAVLESHGKEDRIIFESKRVQEAIKDYVDEHGSPPKKLEDLVPKFIGSIPAIPEISRVDYHLTADGEGWTLDLYRSNLKVPLIYRRTNTGLSPEDAERRIDTENGCYVLKAH